MAEKTNPIPLRYHRETLDRVDELVEELRRLPGHESTSRSELLRLLAELGMPQLEAWVDDQRRVATLQGGH